MACGGLGSRPRCREKKLGYSPERVCAIAFEICGHVAAPPVWTKLWRGISWVFNIYIIEVKMLTVDQT